MRWICVLLATSVVATSPWLLPQSARAQYDPATSQNFGSASVIRINATQSTLTAFHTVDLPSTPAEPVPEPSSIVALGLVGMAFLVRRRRARLD